MALTLDVTVGGASANSMVSLAEFDASIAGHLFASDAEAATDDRKSRALITASRMLRDYIEWNGLPSQLGQTMPFPRNGLFYPSSISYGTLVPSNIIPTMIKEAVIELARYLLTLTEDPAAVPSTEGLTSMTVGPIDLAFDGKINRTNPIIPRDVISRLACWGRERGTSISVPLLRV